MRDQLTKLVQPTLIGKILTKFNAQAEKLFEMYLSDFVHMVQVTSLEDIKGEKFYEV